MLYSLYETQRRALKPVSQSLNYLSQSMGQVEMLFPANPVFNLVKAQANWLSEFTKTYPKPSFNINTINLKGKICPIKEEIVVKKTFCELIHFKKTEQIGQQPAMLIVAPLSGHYATLLRDTVKRCLSDFDVYVTDWLNPSEIPVSEGDFGFDDYVQYVIDFIADLNQLHGHCDVLAVCQPTVPVLTATAYLEKTNPQQSPRSVTVMGGPIDTRKAPTEVNKYAMKNDIQWFKSHVLYTVPMYYKGAGRLVYPGFLQYMGFVSMNLKKHTEAHWEFFNYLLKGADLDAQKHRDFYDEYNAVMDLPAKYYIETLEKVFMDQHLAKGKMKFKDTYVSLGDIKNVKILAVEGENDDISGREQTFAVLDLTTGLSDDKKRKFLAPTVGHYGVFSGKRWRDVIYPEIVKFMIEEETPVNKSDVVEKKVDSVVEVNEVLNTVEKQEVVKSVKNALVKLPRKETDLKITKKPKAKVVKTPEVKESVEKKTDFVTAKINEVKKDNEVDVISSVVKEKDSQQKGDVLAVSENIKKEVTQSEFKKPDVIVNKLSSETGNSSPDKKD